MDRIMEENIQSLHAGTVLCGGKYIIEKKIGEGGFGITYKAIQNGLNRAVCIKEYFLAGRCARNTRSRTVYVQGTSEALFEKYRQGFVKEAKILATLHHSNIVEVLDVFDENNTSYMVMDFIKGKSLQSLVESNGRLPYPEAVNYMAQVAGAVGYIHERNILHRDIKPDNIMITDDYKAILIDFGSAREFEHDKTQVHTSMLTHGYAPTEQYTANSRKGYYTDIYAIGATLYFILTGQVPLEAAARMTEPMPSPKELAPEIPDEANRTILKAMQLKAENRHQCIQDFMDDLRNVKPSVLVDETIGAGSKNKKLWVGLGVVGCVIVFLLVFLIFRPKKIDEVPGPGNKYETVDFTGMDMYPMIKVVGGTCEMGYDDTNEADCVAHRVTVSDFYIGQYEVSQKLWEYIMRNNPSEYRDSEKELPVENVSFSDVQVFIRKLNSRTGQKFSLPTEAQWEYAARGGAKSQGSLYAGDPEWLWYSKKNEGPHDIKLDASVNELGIYQMSGNVAEWCLDYYDEDFYEESADSHNPINKKGENHVVRGGSFEDSDKENVTVYYRDDSNAAKPYIGFRLVINE